MKLSDYLQAQNAVQAYEAAISRQNAASSAQIITINFGTVNGINNITLGPLNTTLADGSSEATLANKIINAITNYYSDKVANCKQDMKAAGIDP